MLLSLDHLLLQGEAVENNNREPHCNDKTRTLPVVMIASMRADVQLVE